MRVSYARKVALNLIDQQAEVEFQLDVKRREQNFETFRKKPRNFCEFASLSPDQTYQLLINIQVLKEGPVRHRKRHKFTEKESGDFDTLSPYWCCASPCWCCTENLLELCSNELVLHWFYILYCIFA